MENVYSHIFEDGQTQYTSYVYLRPACLLGKKIFLQIIISPVFKNILDFQVEY